MSRIIDLNSGKAMVITDLHGAWDVYRRLRDIFLEQLANGEVNSLVICGDLIHNEGMEEFDASLDMLLDVMALQAELGNEKVIMLLGNHELPHIYGLTLAKGSVEFTPRFESALTRRDRRDVAGDAGEAPPRAPRRRGATFGGGARPQGRRACARRDPPRSRGHGARRSVPRGPLLPSERGHAEGAEPAGTRERHPRARRAFLGEVRRREARHGPRAAMARLVAYGWPGNVRQLENEIRRALVLADERIDTSELSTEVSLGAGQGPEGRTLRDKVDALEAELVREALRVSAGNQSRAAQDLGLSRFGLQKMMKRLGIKVG